MGLDLHGIVYRAEHDVEGVPLVLFMEALVAADSLQQELVVHLLRLSEPNPSHTAKKT